MQKTIVITSAALMLLSFSGCAGLKPDLDESDNYIVITGNKFRKSGAINTDILWAGVKRNSGVNTFDPKFFPVIEHEITTRQVTEAFNEQTREVAFDAAVKANIEIADGSVGGNVSSESKVTGKYSVFTLFHVNDFVSELNSPRNRENIEMLMRYDNPRIVTSIATVFNRESSETLSKSGNVSLKIKNAEIGNPEFKIKAESSGEAIAKLSDGTVFAYEYARICWEKRGDKIQIATLEVDRPGIDDNCPAGTDDNASEL